MGSSGNNYEGLLGYFFFLAGLAVGGLAIVALAMEHIPFFIAGAVVGVVCLAVGIVLWLNVSHREHHDPLEPTISSAGVRRYQARRRAGTC